MVTIYDYATVVFYLLFMLAVGIVFRRMSQDTSDYFRAGGCMPWWLTGVSAWMFSFSAWTFTGAAGKVYQAGTLVLAVFYASSVALLFTFFFTGIRFRRMRVITWMEAVRLRYGPFTEQFYTWFKLPLLLFFSGVSLNAIGVFLAAVFRLEMNTVLIALGVVVTLMSFAGGSWAVLASDFVQAFLVVTITICTAALTLSLPEVGGITGLIRRVPENHFDWTQSVRPEFIFLWILSNLWLKFSDENNMERSSNYLMTRGDRDARLMALIPMIGMLVGPLIWFIPSMAATILHPDLASEFPGLKQPQEAAFVAVALDVLPAGLLGLLISAMLAATVTTVDAGLNKNVGICIRNLYKPLIYPQASERHLLIAGRICTLVFGATIVWLALLVNRYRDTNLFDFMNQLAANFLIPLALPLIYGLFFRRTPNWSAWSTALVAGIASWIIGNTVTPEWLQSWMGWKTPLTPDEATYLKLAVTTLGGTVCIGSAWYFFTSLFYRHSPARDRERIEAFFRNLETPVEADANTTRQDTVYRLLGRLCMAYGAFITTLILIPNDLTGRLSFLFCGGIMLVAGFIILRAGRRKAAADAPV
ncbi:MAG: transporter, partial [Verrucomicrobia bacterium]